MLPTDFERVRLRWRSCLVGRIWTWGWGEEVVVDVDVVVVVGIVVLAVASRCGEVARMTD